MTIRKHHIFASLMIIGCIMFLSGCSQTIIQNDNDDETELHKQQERALDTLFQNETDDDYTSSFDNNENVSTVDTQVSILNKDDMFSEENIKNAIKKAEENSNTSTNINQVGGTGQFASTQNVVNDQSLQFYIQALLLVTLNNNYEPNSDYTESELANEFGIDSSLYEDKFLQHHDQNPNIHFWAFKTTRDNKLLDKLYDIKNSTLNNAIIIYSDKQDSRYVFFISNTYEESIYNKDTLLQQLLYEGYTEYNQANEP